MAQKWGIYFFRRHIGVIFQETRIGHKFFWGHYGTCETFLQFKLKFSFYFFSEFKMAEFMWREKTVLYNRSNFHLIQQVRIAEFINSCILFENIFRLGYGEVIYPVDSAI